MVKLIPRYNDSAPPNAVTKDPSSHCRKEMLSMQRQEDVITYLVGR